MAEQTNFEVHTLKGGKWVIDSTYSKRDDAMEVAKELHGEKSFDGVKVIKDTVSANGDASEIAIYDTSKKPKPRSAPPPKEEAAPAKPKANAGVKAPAKKKQASGTGPIVKWVLLLSLLMFVGLGLLLGLGELSKFMNKNF